ncbi:MAG: hypothetical protein WAM60_15125 [Candidatus Promineifilaceae bacterium]
MNQHLVQAIAAARAGKKPQAKVLLARVIKDEPDNVNAWFLLSSLADTEEQKIQRLEKVLELQPGYPAAAEQLAELLPESPEPDEEALHDTLIYVPEKAPSESVSAESEAEPEMEAAPEAEPDMFPLPDIDATTPDVPDDPDEAMAWLERLAADQGVPYEELPSLSGASEATETIIEAAVADDAEPESVMESDVPDDPDEAMAWLEQLAAEQGAPLEELPSLSASEQEAQEAVVEETEEDYSWLEQEMVSSDDYLEAAMPTMIETPASDVEEDGQEEEGTGDTARTLAISNDYDFVSQSKGDSIPAWLAGEEEYIGAETVLTGPAPEEETAEEPEPENLPDWLNEAAEGWVGDEGEKSGQVMWKAGEGDEGLKPTPPAAGTPAKKKSKASAKKTAASSGGNGLYLAFLVIVAILLIAAILYILVTQPL